MYDVYAIDLATNVTSYKTVDGPEDFAEWVESLPGEEFEFGHTCGNLAQFHESCSVEDALKLAELFDDSEGEALQVACYMYEHNSGYESAYDNKDNVSINYSTEGKHHYASRDVLKAMIDDDFEVYVGLSEDHPAAMYIDVDAVAYDMECNGVNVINVCDHWVCYDLC